MTNNVKINKLRHELDRVKRGLFSVSNAPPPVAIAGPVNRVSSTVASEVIVATQTEIATATIAKASAATALVFKLNYEGVRQFTMWADTTTQFSRTDVLFSGNNGVDILSELIIKVDGVVNGVSQFIRTGFLYATRYAEVVINGVAAGSHTVSVELTAPNTTLVRQRQITVLEM